MKYPELSYTLDFFHIQVIFMTEENMRWQVNQKIPPLRDEEKTFHSAVAERSP